MKEIKEKAKKVKLVAFDIDGVMTNGDITYSDSGIEIKTFNAKDGQGLNMLKDYGFVTAFITARQSAVVERRAKDLNITHVYQGVKNKLLIMEELLEKYSLDFDNVCYMGDDLPDLCILNKVGLPSCPNDAVFRVRETALFVSSKNGGGGAVRELCDLLIDNCSESV